LLKLILIGAIIYLAVNIYRFISDIKITGNIKSGADSEKDDALSKMDIQDAEFKDLDNQD